jgi:hypothetical protein
MPQWFAGGSGRRNTFAVSLPGLSKGQATNAQDEQPCSTVDAEQATDFCNGAYAVAMAGYLTAVGVEQI